ncbi:TPA: COG3650 family protein, partial [Klebsiella pneumoniae]
AQGWQLQPCQAPTPLRLSVDAAQQRALENLANETGGPLFIDFKGHSLPGQQVQLDELLRLQGEGHGCQQPGFARQLLQARGHEPEWQLQVSQDGLVLQRPGQPALALPYLEEQLPDGRFSLSSQADGEQLELWLSPRRCVDSMDGSLWHLSAELRLSGVRLPGCGAIGGARH